MDFFKEYGHILGLIFMPVTYGFAGWLTNWVALKMTFYPLEFRGLWDPYIGWQGIIPRKAHKMAGKAVDIVTERLLKVREIFAKLEADKITENLGEDLNQAVIDIVDYAGHRLYRDAWNVMPDLVKEQVSRTAGRQAPKIMQGVLKDVQEDIDDIFDIKGLIIRNLTGPKAKLLVEMFQQVGAPEFKFIERSGFYFGFMLGLVQVAVWSLFPALWTLPIQGLIVGYATNWLALTMIFRPLHRRKFGPIHYQGLFLKRQNEVSEEYSRMIAQRILTAENLVEELFFGSAADRIFRSIDENVRKAIDEGVGVLGKPMVIMTAGEPVYDEVREFAVQVIKSRVPQVINKINPYVEEAMEIEKTMAERMKQLSPEEFEHVLRTAFKEDELILILVGAAIGGMIGLMQTLVM